MQINYFLTIFLFSSLIMSCVVLANDSEIILSNKREDNQIAIKMHASSPLQSSESECAR